jgi:ComF family protein
MYVRQVASAAADLLWPPRCLACARKISGHGTSDRPAFFCPACLDTLSPITSPFCAKCGLPFDSAGPDHLCGFCIAAPPHFSRARAVFHYGGALAKAIGLLKYAKKVENAVPLSHLLAQGTRSLKATDLALPVPLHRQRLRARGFNQSALLAQVTAKRLRVPLVTDILFRVKDTAGQMGLNRTARLDNLKDAFLVKTPTRVQGRRIVLVDDVITTSATVREASKALIRAGANEVQVIALARASDVQRLAPFTQNR